MKNLHPIFQKILVILSNAVTPSKISSAKAEKKKGYFSRTLQLIKYEREKIPLPKVTIPTLHDNQDEKERTANEESAFQHYYLHQFINVEKQQEFKRRREKKQKTLAHAISFMHFLSMTCPMSQMKCGPALNVRLYNPTLQSVTFGKNRQR